MECAGTGIQRGRVRGNERDYGGRDMGDWENVGREGVVVWEGEAKMIEICQGGKYNKIISTERKEEQ